MENPQAKLGDADVLAIRASRELQRCVAARYGVSQTLISRIRRREKWAWLDEKTVA
jgi:hypothetical protein